MTVTIKLNSTARAPPAPAKLGLVPSMEGDGSASPQAPARIPARR